VVVELAAPGEGGRTAAAPEGLASSVALLAPLGGAVLILVALAAAGRHAPLASLAGPALRVGGSPSSSSHRSSLDSVFLTELYLFATLFFNERLDPAADIQGCVQVVYSLAL
jgi:hypothetical protein